MKIHILIFCCSFLFFSAKSQLPVVEISPTTIYLGETIDLKITAESSVFPGKVSWLLPDSIHPFQYLTVDTTTANRCLIKLTAWDTGYLQLKLFQLLYTKGSKIKRVPVSFGKVYVKWADYKGKEPEDIKPIIETKPKKNTSLLVILFGSIAVVMLVLSLFMYRRKRRNQITESSLPQEPVTSDLFLSYLEKLRPAEWTTHEKQKVAFLAIRQYAQHYISHKTGDTTAGTFYEQIHHPFLFSNENMLQSFISIAHLMDKVIYAKYVATKEEVKELLLTFQIYLEQEEKDRTASEENS